MHTFTEFGKVSESDMVTNEANRRWGKAFFYRVCQRCRKPWSTCYCNRLGKLSKARVIIEVMADKRCLILPTLLKVVGISLSRVHIILKRILKCDIFLPDGYRSY